METRKRLSPSRLSGEAFLPDGSHINVRDRYFSGNVQRGVPVVSKALLSKLTGAPMVLVLRPLRGTKGQLLGAVGTSMRINGLLDRVAHQVAELVGSLIDIARFECYLFLKTAEIQMLL